MDEPDGGCDAPGECASPEGNAEKAAICAGVPDAAAGPGLEGVSRAEAASSRRMGPCAWAKDGWAGNVVARSAPVVGIADDIGAADWRAPAPRSASVPSAGTSGPIWLWPNVWVRSRHGDDVSWGHAADSGAVVKLAADGGVPECASRPVAITPTPRSWAELPVRPPNPTKWGLGAWGWGSDAILERLSACGDPAQSASRLEDRVRDAGPDAR